MQAEDTISRAAESPGIAPDAAGGPSPGPASGGATAAVQVALTASPGATAAAIAAAAGVSRSATAKALAALESAGTATRTPGERTGRIRSPDTWNPAADHAPGASAADPAEAAGATAPAIEYDTVSLPPAGEESAEPDQDEPAGARPALAAQPAGADPAADPGDHAGGQHAGAATTSSAEAARLVDELTFAARRAASALTSGQPQAAITELDQARANAAQATRLIKAAVTGRKAAASGTGMRPGQLRDRIRAHLDNHPGTAFTPYEIARVLGNSAGAVANALDRLTALGRAELSSEHPRKYTAVTAADASGS